MTTASDLSLVSLLLVAAIGCGGTPDQPKAADPDERTAVVLPAQGRHLILGEMRIMLTSVQDYVAAAALGDTAAMRAAATASGVVAARDLDPAMQSRLPAEFVRLGMSTHVAWDSLAADVGRGAPTNVTLGRLGTIMNNCVACHAQFRINLEP